MQTGISVFSLLTNNKGRDIHFFLIHPKCITEEISKIHSTIVSFGSTYSTIYTDDLDPLLNRVDVPPYNGTRTVYYRLFLGEFIPNIDRLLYLDGDTII